MDFTFLQSEKSAAGSFYETSTVKILIFWAILINNVEYEYKWNNSCIIKIEKYKIKFYFAYWNDQYLRWNEIIVYCMLNNVIDIG